MIHISKSKDNQFFVDVISPNGEIIQYSETLKTKQSAWKNIAATAKAYNSRVVFVQDDCFKKPVMYEFYVVQNKKKRVEIKK